MIKSFSFSKGFFANISNHPGYLSEYNNNAHKAPGFKRQAAQV